MMKRFITTIVSILLTVASYAQNADIGHVCVASRDTCDLMMDVYMPSDGAGTHPCIVFLFGGGFFMSTRSSDMVISYCNAMRDYGFVTCAPDYRLGLKDVKSSGILGMVAPLEKAINMAVEDGFSAIRYILDHAEDLHVDTSKIILVGSSAGAITALQMDYELCNRGALTSEIPDDFHFAGVLSYAGAVFSRKGMPLYKNHDPAPTFFSHGMKDDLVVYDKIEFMSTGFYGSNQLEKQFKKFRYPHVIYRYEGRQHEVSSYFLNGINDGLKFIEDYVMNAKQYIEDVTITELNIDPESVYTVTKNDIYITTSSKPVKL